MTAGGYFGQTLVADASTGAARTLPLPDDLLRAYIGGAGLALGGHVVAALNGDQITRDGEVPLATGDVLFFLSAGGGG